MMIGFAAWGQDKKRMGLPKARCPKKASAPFLVGEKQAFAPPSFRTNPKGRVLLSCKCLLIGGRASLEAIPIGRDKAKSRWVQ